MHHSEHLFSALKAAAVALDLPHAVIELDGYTITVSRLASYEEAQLYQHALVSLSEMRNTLGQAQLQALWHMYQNDFVEYMGGDGMEYNAKDFAIWLRHELTGRENLEYIVTLGYIVARVFQDVHTKHMAGTPYQDEHGDVTVDRLIAGEGLISRLTTISSAWEKASDEDREKLVDSALNAPSRNATKKVTDSVRDGESAPDFDQPVYHISTRGELTDLHFIGLDAKQAAFIQGLLTGKAMPDYTPAGAIFGGQ